MSLKDNLSGVTVNGKPAVEYIAKTQPKRIRNKAFTNGISRNLNLPEPEPDFTEWVLMNGVQYLRAAKEPFAKSGFGLAGAQLYDPDSDKLKCNECGEWFLNYGPHSAHSAKEHPNGKQYRKLHKLDAGTKLCGLRFQRKIRAVSIFTDGVIGSRHAFKNGQKRAIGGGKRPSLERQNAISNCPVQIPHNLKLLAGKLGRTPTFVDIKTSEYPKFSIHAIYRIFGTFHNALLFAGLTLSRSYRKGEIKSQSGKYTQQELLQGLMAHRSIYGRWPKQREVNKSDFLPSYPAYRRLFGGLPQAIAKAESRLTV